MTNSDDEHRCPELLPGGVHIVRAEYHLEDSDWSWSLIVCRLATPTDLEENHYLEEEGETIWQTIVGISHCPFCGAALEADIERPIPREADFHHIDSSGWHSKRL